MTLRHDYLGNPFVATRDGTAAAVDGFVAGFLGYETRAIEIVAAAERDPENCIANLYAAAFALFAETPEAPAQAIPFLRHARAAAANATARERRLLEYVTLWQRDNIPAALELGLALVGEHPRDLALVKLQQYLAFNIGDLAGMLRVATLAAPHAQDVAALHGMHAFALEECQLLEEARQAAGRALSLDRAEPWALHTLAHLSLGAGEPDGIARGAQCLEHASGRWDRLNSFISTHLWWHLALCYESQGRFAGMLQIYDRHVAGIDPAYSQCQAGAISLLARLDLAGVDPGPRWAELAPHLVRRADDTVQPFLTLHYLYAFARLGVPETATLMRAARIRAWSSPAWARGAWAEVTLPACEGIVAFHEGDFRLAVRCLGAALPRLREIGGSHAQRDLFERVFDAALRRAGDWATLQQRLEARRRFDPCSVPVNRGLAEAYTALGLPGQAAAAAQRAWTTIDALPPGEP